ncbi:MAG: glycosyl transferase group 1 [Firmicutes bacterium]|nr:glycosyl transferase group 1 [Bacillota bacterium]
MERKNLLVLVANIGIGGQERIAINTADILQKDYNTILVIFNKQECNYEFGGTLLNLELPPVTGTFNKMVNLLRRARALQRLKREHNIDITLSLGTSANFVNVLSRASDKILVSVHGYGALTRSRWDKIIGKLVFGKADTVITVAQKLSADLADLYNIPAAKVKTLHNPYNIAAIIEGAKEPVSVAFHSPVVVSVGRMQEVKGFRHLINAMAHVVKEIPQAKLLLVGDGDEMTALQEHSRKMGLAGHVTFVGFQPNPFRYEAKCDLYVLSSINEGFPNTLVEAMACGLPVVATDCKTGPREILTETFEDKTAEKIEYVDYGVLVPPFAADESHEPQKDKMLAEAIVELLTNRERTNYYKAKAAERARTFSFETYRKKVIQIIEG